MPSPYTLGETVVLTAMVRDPDTNDLVDPVSVTIKAQSPGTGGATTVPTVTHASTGVYTATVDVTTPGQWWWRVETTGPTDAAERMFYVNSSTFS